MAISHSIAVNWSGDGRSISQSNSFSSSAQVSVDESVANGQTDFLINVAIDVSAIKSVYILSDQDVTFETNSGGTPDDTISLKAGIPYIWHTNSYHTNLLTTDITKVYITNASGSTAAIKMECVQDSSP